MKASPSPASAHWLDLPPVAAVRRLTLRAQREVQSPFVGAYRSAFRGSGLELERVRPYQAGDDPRSIEWSVSARANELHVREFREERELKLLVLLDISPSMYFGPPGERYLEAGLYATTLLASAALVANDAVGFQAFGQGTWPYWPPARSRSRFRQALLSALRLPAVQPREAQLHEAQQLTHLPRALQEAMRRLTTRAVVLLVTDGISAHEADVRPALRQLARRHELLVVQPVLAPEALQQLSGGIPYLGWEGGRGALWQPPAFWPKPKKQALAWLKQPVAEHRAWARSGSWDHLALRTDRSVLRQVQGFLAKREPRRF